MLKKLPIGIQDFRKLREENCIYVDKTEILLKLITEGSYYFLSRPRRFGKSLMISTLAEIYEGSKELFEGLYIYDKIEWKKRPVIRVDFTADTFKKISLEEAITNMLRLNYEKYGLTIKEKTNRAQLRDLIMQLHEKTGEKVSLLIDEYDKPIIDYLENIPKAVENRETLRDFYGIIKPMDPHLEFVILTGVSKFSKVSIFSELNNLNDITTNFKYSTIAGLTKEEIDFSFIEYKKVAAETLSISTEELDSKLKFWYDGYSWDNEKSVYNPFSLLSFFNGLSFENYWFATGTPTFLVNFIRDKGISAEQIEKTEVDSIFFDRFDIERLDIISLMFQTGYLTIKDRDKDGFYHLDYPNEEVRRSFTGHLLGSYAEKEPSETSVITRNLLKAFRSNDMESFEDNINALFSSIPYQIFIKKREAYYHSIIYLILKMLGVYIDAEVSVSKGRIDATIKTDDYLYVLEFKVLPQTADDAINQIVEKGYCEPFKTDKRDKFMLGISFDPEKKAVAEMKVEKF